MLERISSSFSSNTTNVCEQDFEIILQGILKRDMWAMKIFDAWGKPLLSGLLSGHVHWMGNYDECSQQMHLPTNKSFVSQPINTQYCTLLPKPPLSITLGLCVPSSCNQKSVASLIEILFKNSSITENDLICSNDPPYGQQGLARDAIITYTDISEFKLIQVPQNSTSRIIFLAEFSAIRTLRRIFTMKIKNNDDSFLFINGIRVLSLCWVIIGHSIAFSLSYTNNIVDVIVWTRNIAFQLIINATLSVDTFFVLSGFL
ncbi:unnamed protein product, partial [Adineta steineri]